MVLMYMYHTSVISNYVQCTRFAIVTLLQCYYTIDYVKTWGPYLYSTVSHLVTLLASPKRAVPMAMHVNMV